MVRSKPTVTTINDDITLLQEWLQLLDEIINSGTSLYKEDNLAGSLQLLA